MLLISHGDASFLPRGGCDQELMSCFKVEVWRNTAHSGQQCEAHNLIHRQQKACLSPKIVTQTSNNAVIVVVDGRGGNLGGQQGRSPQGRSPQEFWLDIEI